MHRISLALRGFRRSPGFFATAVLIVGLGIGMSVAIFSVFRTVLVRRLPVVDQDRIVVMWTYVTDPNTEVTLGTKELSVVRQESRTMREVAGIAHWPAASLPYSSRRRWHTRAATVPRSTSRTATWRRQPVL